MRRTGRRAAAGILALALLTALLSACQEGSSTETEESESGYKIYYLNQSETAVDTVDYEPSGSGTEELISEFLEQLAAVPSETDLKAVLTQEAAVASYTLENGQLSLNFGIDYQKMSATKEILTRMAVVCTLCQIPEVEYVTFLVGENPLTDSAETPIGPMNAESFVENPGSGADDYTVTTATLYFANESGDKLVREM